MSVNSSNSAVLSVTKTRLQRPRTNRLGACYMKFSRYICGNGRRSQIPSGDLRNGELRGLASAGAAKGVLDQETGLHELPQGCLVGRAAQAGASYSPFHDGGRFSRNAVVPSVLSAVAERLPKAWASRSR